MSRFRRYLRDEYRWSSSELPRVADHLRREAAELDILDTATDVGRPDRREAHWGGRWVTIQNTDDRLITAFHMRDGDEVSFDLVFATDPLPDWVQDPTWWEQLDLT